MCLQTGGGWEDCLRDIRWIRGCSVVVLNGVVVKGRFITTGPSTALMEVFVDERALHEAVNEDDGRIRWLGRWPELSYSSFILG